MSKITGIIFDLDGTLLNTVEDIMDSCNIALKKLDYPLHSLKEYKQFIGEGMEELVRKALPQDKRDEENIKICLELLREEYKKRYHNKTKPYDGIKDLLKTLLKRGIKMAVFSNKPDDFTLSATKYYFPEIDFCVVLGAKEGNPKKPDPYGANFIIKKLNIPKENIAYLGDSKTDIMTAKNCGVLSVGAEWGFRGKEELISAGADYIVKTPDEFLVLIDKLK